MPYITGQREQTQLFPACIEEYIGTEDPVRAYDAFVDALDFVQLGIEDDPYRVGAPQFDPRAMLKLLVYGYSYGIRSSRKLERATYHQFPWLDRIWLERHAPDVAAPSNATARRRLQTLTPRRNPNRPI